MQNSEKKPRVGFIGQGWIGRHYADDFESRGFEVIRYAKEPPYDQYQAQIKDCDIVFIAVPTPTTAHGFDSSIVESVLSLVGKHKIAVIKSTLLPGTTQVLQQKYPDIVVLHSPEFLSVSTAAHDAAHPVRNIIGIPQVTEEYKLKAEYVLSTLPNAPHSIICTSLEAEVIKYGRNCLGYVRVVFLNVFYDLAVKLGVDWSVIEKAMSADEFNGPRYMTVRHQGGRGAGGACFIKDFAAFNLIYQEMVNDPLGVAMLKIIEAKNIELLKTTHKDFDILTGVYGQSH